MSGAPEDTQAESLQQPDQGELSRLAVQTRAHNSRVLQLFDDELADDWRRWSRIDPRNIVCFPQVSSGGGGWPRDVVDDIEQDGQIQVDGGAGVDAYTGGMGVIESLQLEDPTLDMPWRLGWSRRESDHGRTNTAELPKRPPSVDSILDAAEPVFPLPRFRGWGIYVSTPSLAPLSDMQYPDLDVDMDETAFQNVLSDTEQRELQPNNSESQAKSAALCKALSEARSKKLAEPMESLSTSSANTQSSHSDNDRAGYPFDMAQIGQHTSLNAHEPDYVDDAPQHAPNSAGESEELDIESILASQEVITAHQPKPIKHHHRPEQKHIHRISQIVVDICRGPRKQREKETVRLLTSLGLSQLEQQSAFSILQDMFIWNKKAKNHEDPVVFRKWLCLLIYDEQIRASAANSTSNNINEAKIKGLFCKEGIHLLKCGHTSRSNEECGMNCVIFSSPDTPIIDVRMSEILCNECGNWR